MMFLILNSIKKGLKDLVTSTGPGLLGHSDTIHVKLRPRDRRLGISVKLEQCIHSAVPLTAWLTRKFQS